MKRLLVFLAILAIAAAAIYASLRPRGFATPAECLDAYAEACKDGDVARYRDCLGEPLRSATQSSDPRELAEAIRQQARDVKGRVQQAPSALDGSTVEVVVEEIRVSGQRQVRYRLENTGRGWLIVAIQTEGETQPTIPYGTHIGKAPR